MTVTLVLVIIALALVGVHVVNSKFPLWPSVFMLGLIHLLANWTG